MDDNLNGNINDSNVESNEDITTKEDIRNLNVKNKKGKKCIVFVVIILLLIIVVCSAYFVINKNKTTKKKTEEKTLLTPLADMVAANDISNFDFAILKQYNNEESIVYSPLSLKYALGMLSEGASGESKSQIDSVIGNYRFSKMINTKNISMNNTLFVRNGFNINQSYIDDIVDKYNANIFKDDFKSTVKMNEYISKNTFGLIKDGLGDDDIDGDYILSNMLAINLKWNYQIQMGDTDESDPVDRKVYYVDYDHEDYYDAIWSYFDFSTSKGTFNGKDALMAEIKASANRYDIVSEIGSDNIKNTVKEAYYKENGSYDMDKSILNWQCTNTSNCLDVYVDEIDKNYGRLDTSTDFYYYKDEDVTVFAKDLRKTDDMNLQYISIMPNKVSLKDYISSFDSDKASNIISNLKDADDYNSYKDGVVTQIYGKIPMFNTNTYLDLNDMLESMGIVDVFDSDKADLTKIAAGAVTTYVKQKANIEFTNEGITAAVFSYAGGAGDVEGWDYKYDVPIEKIDLTFDKPFMYIIRNKDTNEIWFAGSVYDATELMSDEEYYNKIDEIDEMMN